MNGFERRTQLKKEAIIKAALELFIEKGVKDTGIAEIAEKANVSQVTLYNHFNNKNNLIKQVSFKLMDKLINELEKLLDSDLSFSEKFERMYFIKAGSVNSENEEIFQSVMFRDSEVQAFAQDYYQTRTIPLLLELIEQGKKEGFVDSELSHEAILLYIGMFKDMASKHPLLELNPKVRSDLGILFFHGFAGIRIV